MNNSCWNKTRSCQHDAFWYITKKLRTIVFGNWNKTRMNPFLENGKSSSNVPNVFKGSSLTGHRVRVYWESRTDIYRKYPKIKFENTVFKFITRKNIYLSEVSIPSFLAPLRTLLHFFKSHFELRVFECLYMFSV